MYTLGQKSRKNLEGVHPSLVKIVHLAIELTSQDFTVYEGVRTLERQKKLVASGASKTLRSMHIPGPDRLGGPDTWGHAVDLVPWIDGAPRWEWGPIYPIATAMQAAAKALGHGNHLCWGGVWDQWISAYTDPRAAVTTYCARHPGPDFIDGPHFQLGRLG